MLANAGCDVNAVDKQELTPFHYAVQKGSVQIVRLLHEYVGLALTLTWHENMFSY